MKATVEELGAISRPRAQPPGPAPDRGRAYVRPSEARREQEGPRSFRKLLDGKDESNSARGSPIVPGQSAQPNAETAAALCRGVGGARPDLVSLDLGRQGSSTASPTVDIVDKLLGQTARDVTLASDGLERYVLRFELSRGELRGTQIALSSEAGVVSAIVSAPHAEAAARLEIALETARHSLEGRGITVGEMEVGTGRGDRDDRDRHPSVAREKVPSGADAPRPERSERGGSGLIDYYV